MYLHREILAVVGLVRVTVPTTWYQLHMCHMEHLTLIPIGICGMGFGIDDLS